MGCWDIVDFPSDTMLLGVRWVFKIKMIENECERHKSRLVVKGYMCHVTCLLVHGRLYLIIVKER